MDIKAEENLRLSASAEAIEPTEVFFEKLGDREIRTVFAYLRKKLIFRWLSPAGLAIGIFAIFCFVYRKTYLTELLISFLSAAAVYAVFVIRDFVSLYRAKRSWQKTAEDATFECRIYDRSMRFTAFRDGAVIRMGEVLYEDITAIARVSNFALIAVGDGLFIVDMYRVSPGSYLVRVVKDFEKEHEPKESLPMFILSMVLIVLAFVVPWIGGDCVIAKTVDWPYGSIQAAYWAYLLFLPVPLGVMLFGIIARRKGYHASVNIVVGILMTAILLANGLYPFLVPC